jgi:hypothetical protein
MNTNTTPTPEAIEQRIKELVRVLNSEILTAARIGVIVQLSPAPIVDAAANYTILNTEITRAY